MRPAEPAAQAVSVANPGAHYKECANAKAAPAPAALLLLPPRRRARRDAAAVPPPRGAAPLRSGGAEIEVSKVSYRRRPAAQAPVPLEPGRGSRTRRMGAGPWVASGSL